MTATSSLLDLLAIDLPIVQAPMAGVSTPAMAAAVADAGALGSHRRRWRPTRRGRAR